MEHLLVSFSAVSGSSQQLVNLASALLGGSVALVIGTSHMSPKSRRARMIYLILLPTWAFLVRSILAGDTVLRKYLAATIANVPERVMEIFEEANGMYATQLNCLRLAILFFAIWLVIYMIWWVFYREPNAGEKC